MRTWRCSSAASRSNAIARFRGWQIFALAFLFRTQSQLLGWGAWGIAVPPVLVGLWLASRPIPSAMRMVGWLALYVDGLAALHLMLRAGDGLLPGGRVGWAVGAGLEAVFGPIGAWFGVGGAGLVLLTGLFRIDWGWVLRALVDRAEVWVPKLGEVAKIGAVRGGSAGVTIAGILGALGWRAVRKAGVKVGDGLGGMHGAVRRMGESLVRDDDPFPALHAAAETGRAYLEEDAGSIPVDPTVPRSAMVGASIAAQRPFALDRPLCLENHCLRGLSQRVQRWC